MLPLSLSPLSLSYVASALPFPVSKNQESIVEPRTHLHLHLHGISEEASGVMDQRSDGENAHPLIMVPSLLPPSAAARLEVAAVERQERARENAERGVREAAAAP